MQRTHGLDVASEQVERYTDAVAAAGDNKSNFVRHRNLGISRLI